MPLISESKTSAPSSAFQPSEGVAATAYAERTSTLAKEAEGLQRRHLQLGWLRLLLALAFIVLLFPPRLYALLPLIAFVIVARIHAQVLARLTAARRAIAFYAHGTARLEDRWAGRKPRSFRADSPDHLYAADLDLFGDHSLFELLCETRTSLGEAALGTSLLRPCGIPVAQARQAAVAELRPKLDLRQAFAAAPGPDTAELDREALIGWGTLPPLRIPQALRFVAPFLVLLTFLAAWRYATAHTPLALTVMLIVDACLTYGFQAWYRPLFLQVSRVSQSLRTIAALSGLIEAESLTAPLLVELQGRLQKTKGGASAALRSLARLDRWAEERGNYMVRLLDTPFLYSLQLALAMESWRKQHGSQLQDWLNTLGQFEALLSLASYSYENPADVFPSFLPDGPTFAANGLGHPLLPAASCVRNDVVLGRGARLLLISGSNMSGKSTLLRSVGVSAVMAFAGAPVRARALSLSALTLAASIHVNDSLQAGRSRFYSEILRLRAITEAAHSDTALLFLIDEVLAGTNSSDRLAGARGLASDLLNSGAVGMMSTHDLTLTGLSVQDAERIRNAHFEDQVIENKLQFDYKLRPGVLQRSNGIALMRLIGLKV